MNTTPFFVENVKCNGCVSSIKKALLPIPNVDDVEVDLETNTIEVKHHSAIDNSLIYNKLEAMGYPKQGTGTLVNKAVSYVSCAIGKVSN